MSVLAQTALTLLDYKQRLDPNNVIARIIESLSQENEILQDMMFMEGNLPTGHKTTIRTGLPTAYWRLLNQGVQPSKSTTTPIMEGCGKLEAWSEVDCALAELSGDVGGFRASEAKAFIEGMSQEMASTLFYGNSSTAPEEFNGLSIRYSDLSANNASNIIDAGGDSSDNTSIWLVGWGERTCHGIYPKGSMAGLQRKDFGEVVSSNHGGVTGAQLAVYKEQFVWDTGIALKDWRYVVRIANIDVSNLTAKSSAADLIESMIKAIHRIPSLVGCRPAFYMNRTVMQELDIQKRDDVQAGGQLKYEDVDGRPVLSFRGIPIRKCDAILENESAVS